MNLCVDDNIVSAIDMWIEHGIPAGSCTELLLRGRYDEALLHAHPMIKPFWNDHIQYIENYVPIECRNENYNTWKGQRYNINDFTDDKLFEV